MEKEERLGEAKAKSKKTSVVVLYNQVGADWYEHLRHVDPATLAFEPEYPIDVATVKEEYTEIVKALRQAGYRARAVNLQDDLRKLERLLKRNRPDVVFNLVEHFRDDASLEPIIAGMFDLYRIPYTGAPPFALELCMDKWLTKQLLIAHGVPTPRYRVIEEPLLPKRLRLNFPLIIKPAWEDASAGVTRKSVVYSEEELAERIPPVFEEFDQPLLLEEFVDGRELHVAVWGNDPPQMLPPVEYDFSDLPPGYPPLISYAAKWNPLDEVYHRIHTICPAPLSRRLLKRIEQLAIHAYEVTYCRDYARLDIRLRGNKPYVLEVNPNPDLTEGVSFMEAAEAAEYSFDETLARIVELALKREPEPLPVPQESGETSDPGPIQQTTEATTHISD